MQFLIYFHFFSLLHMVQVETPVTSRVWQREMFENRKLECGRCPGSICLCKCGSLCYFFLQISRFFFIFFLFLAKTIGNKKRTVIPRWMTPYVLEVLLQKYLTTASIKNIWRNQCLTYKVKNKYVFIRSMTVLKWTTKTDFSL